MQADWLIKNVRIATMQDIATPYGMIEDGLLAVRGNKIVWIGKRGDAPDFGDTEIINGHGGWLTPGLIDCHTHLVYGGNRAKEFEMRQQGASYEDIARQGGGINSTVTATRNACNDTLLKSALKRLKQLHQQGVTTVEIKSGYGLDLETELRMLKVARLLADKLPVTIKTTFLGAHAVPAEYQGRADDYIEYLCQQLLPVIAEQKLADAVDVFCESIGFTLDQARQLFQCAQAHGLPVKGHVEQLSYLGGARLVAEFDGLSADHLEYIHEDDLPLLKSHDVAAVLLPAAFYFLNESQKPPIEAMRKAGVSMAVASDCNPGSAPMASLLLALNQACVLFGLTPEEALCGATRHAAQALGLSSQKGQLKTGYDADVLLWQIEHPAELSYGINMHIPARIWVNGKDV